MTLLNLSGLGLGYALLRRWPGMAACLTATGLLLLLALPADPDGISRTLLLAYLVFLALAAVHGAAIGLRGHLAWPPRRPVAVLLGLVLLAAPLGSAVAYENARDEAREQQLLDRLEEADRLVRTAGAGPFEKAEPDYRRALTTYAGLRKEHPDSRAADRVPDRLRTYYTTVGAPYTDKDYCEAIAPLKHLRTVPKRFGRKALGRLVTWPDGRLATSLYACGAPRIGRAESMDDAVTAEGGDLHELLTLFPESEQAAKVAPAFGSAVDKATAQTGGDAPCPALGTLRRLDAQAKTLPKAPKSAGALTAVAADARRGMESGSYACGIDQYQDGRFTDARKTMSDFAATYKDNRNTPRARKIAIAAEIAEEEPAAGKRLPTTASGGSIPMVVSNDSPYELEVLYTGPVTGRFTLGACADCTTFSSESDAQERACQADGASYPRRTLNLPAGTSYLLLHSDGADSDADPQVETSHIEANYTYTLCGYVVEQGPGDFDLPELEPIEPIGSVEPVIR